MYDGGNYNISVWLDWSGGGCNGDLLVFVVALPEQVRGPVGHVEHGEHHREQYAGYDVDALGPGRELGHPRLPARVGLRRCRLPNDLAHLVPRHRHLWTHQRLLKTRRGLKYRAVRRGDGGWSPFRRQQTGIIIAWLRIFYIWIYNIHVRVFFVNYSP